jgi:hypothetical protein
LKFIRNHIHKKLEKNRTSQEREETARQNRSRVAKWSRRGEKVETIEEIYGDEHKENQG